jgi:NADH-quinone oxidoreductase subunit M
MTGSMLMLAAILYLAFQHQKLAGYPSFDYLALSRLQLPEWAAWACFFGFGLAFAIKVPMFPLHTWLPDAHVQAPTGGSIVLAAILLKLGTYGYIRFCMGMFGGVAWAAAPTLGGVAVVGGVLYGALVAWKQDDVKRLVAYSSVAHMGFVMLGLFAGNQAGMQGSILQMLNHGVSTGALFLLVGVVYERRHTREISEYGGLSKVMPVYAAIFLVMTMSSIGLPTLNGFIGELLILQGVFVANKVWAAFAGSGVVLGAAYMLYLYQRTMFGKIENPKNEHLADLSHREFATFAPLLILAVWMGIYPAPFLRRLESSVQQIIMRVNPQYAAKYAECNTAPPTAEQIAASSNGAAKFLSSMPCDINGNPLPSTSAGQERR